VKEAAEDGRDGKICESLSDPPDVFLRASGGRAWEPSAGEPARRAAGTASAEGLLVAGEPIWRGDGTSAMLARLRFAMRRLWMSMKYAGRGIKSHALMCKETYTDNNSPEACQVHRAAQRIICDTPAAERWPGSLCVSSLSLSPGQPSALDPIPR
jgi:hypothetical protein